MTDTDESDPPDSPEKPKRGLTWALGALVLLAVVAITLAATSLFGGSDSDSSKASSKSGASDMGPIASAGDTGPITVITADPTCAAWTPINNTLANLGAGRWNERDRSIPASAWDDMLRAQYMAAAQVARSSASQAVGLAELTPHRVMRELYEQFIAYARAYAEHIPEYTPVDNNLAGAANSAASALGAICAAIDAGAAAVRGPLVTPQAPPKQTAPPRNPTNPTRFITAPDPACGDWQSALEQFGLQTSTWQETDPNIPAILWNKDQKAVNYAVAPVMNAYANKLEQLGRASGNPTLEDFAILAAQYRRAFVQSLQTYTPADNHLANAASYSSTVVLGACGSVGIK